MKPEFLSNEEWSVGALPAVFQPKAPIARWSPRFRVFKTAFDLILAIMAVPIVLVTALVLLLINPILNPGPLFFKQTRMGFRRQQFTLWKFRTMSTCPNGQERPSDAPVEEHRITPLGRVLRKFRIDELPNFFNVLRGEMSVIGPRPDAFSHAVKFDGEVPFYGERFRVLPGITGLAQVQGGYADNPRAIERKARWDHVYVTRSRTKMDLYIVAQTVRVMMTGFGAK